MLEKWKEKLQHNFQRALVRMILYIDDMYVIQRTLSMPDVGIIPEPRCTHYHFGFREIVRQIKDNVPYI